MRRIAFAGLLLGGFALLSGCSRQITEESVASTGIARAQFPAGSGRSDPAALFANGGFEDGGLAGWTATSYLDSTGPTCADAGDCANFPPSSESALNLADGGAVTTSAVQGDGGIPLSATLNIFGADGGATVRYPFFGNWAALVNDKSSNSTAWGTGHGSNINKLSQSYQTSAADIDPSDGNIHVRFVVAPALENGSHVPAQQPYYYVQINNITQGTILYSNYAYANQPGVPWQKVLKGLTGYEVDYTNWLLFDVAPGGAGLAVGDTVRVDIIASGCEPGGHAGEVVVDGFGSFIPALTVSASAPTQINTSTPITYVYNVRNGGTGAATNVTVTEPILTGTAYTSFTAPSGAVCTAPAVGATSGNVVCNLGTVNVAATTSFSVTLRGPTTTGVLSNGLYSVGADGIAPLLGNKLNTTIAASGTYADLGITISDGVAAVGWGGSTSYTFTVTNAGPAASPSATISAALPTNAASASWSCATGSGGATITAPASGTGSLSAAVNLPASSSVVCSYAVQLSAGSGSGSLNFVGVVSESTPTDPQPSNNSASDQDQIGTLTNIYVQDDPMGSGTGTVVSTPSAINCTGTGPSCSGQFGAGVQISLTATGAPGSQFSSWSGITCAGGSTGNQCSFSTPASDTTILARFDLLTFAVNTSTNGHGTLTCPMSPTQGSSPVCTLAANSGYLLSALTDNSSSVLGQVVSGSYTIHNIQAAHTVVATFVLVNGQTCSAGTDCGSGNCIDAVCCNGTCGGECQACNLAGSVGSCATVTSGAPRDGRTACAGGATSCAGSCDGTSPTACDYPAATTQCRGASCTGGIETFAAGCAGNGSCPALSTQSCGSYVCGAAACKTSCAADADCTSPNYCSSTHLCVAPCASDGDCSSTNYCNASSRCAPKLGQGISCSATDQCTSGFCTDGVCCNAACGGKCAACDVAGSVGACTELTSGEPHGARGACSSDGSACAGSCNGTSSTACAYPSGSTQCRPASCASGIAIAAASCAGTGSCPSMAATSCGRFNCDPQADACLTTCSADGDCSAGNFCSAGVCSAKGSSASATACSADDQCTSAHCADGFCCDTACNGQCQACDVPGSAGTCSPTPAATAPHTGHTACLDDGTGCGGACDGTATLACAYPSSSTSCRLGSCAAGTATIPAGCNGAGACPAPSSQTCAPYVCGANGCDGNCGSDSDCSSGNWCSGGVCTPQLAPGSACATTNQCGSGFCTDGVCCDTACDGQCAACDVAGSVGTCSPVAAGLVPAGSRNACTGQGSLCGGACDGLSTTACAYPDSGTNCRAASCSNSEAVAAAGCNSAGACPPEQEVSCGLYLCSGTSCDGDCLSDGDCASGSYCAAGICTAKEAPGGTCGVAGQCASGFCTDGVCCNSTCESECEACDVTNHTGVCSPAAAGTAPHGVRPVCADDGSGCGGTCDGTATLACGYPNGSTVCQGPSCTAGIATLGAVCDGAGACPLPPPADCDPYLCGGSACAGSCAIDADCASGNWCQGIACVPALAPGAACTATDQCASGFCTDGVCCNTACDGQCAACDVSGSLGTCSDVSGSPHGARSACSSDGSSCSGSCNGASTSCAYPSASTQCRAASCAGGSAVAAAACAGDGSCPSMITTACGRFNCDAAGDACISICSADTDCSSGNFCSSGVCTSKGASGGAVACSANDQCSSAHCADGFCCDSACNGQCQACDVAGSAGTCSPTPAASAPHAGRTACADDGTGCGGACDGTATLACAYPSSSLSCRPGSCAAGTATLPAGCNGAGACPAAQTQACSPYVCGANACDGNCGSDSDCSSGNWCSGGVCEPQLGAGTACAATDQCASGFCTDGVCCDTACDGQCQACGLPASAGTCSPIPAGGAPQGARSACLTDGSGCGGACDGIQAAACVYPAGGTSCRDPSCTAGVATLGASCDGAGNCPALQQQSCGAFACAIDACSGDCVSDSDCAAADFCSASMCTLRLVQGIACSTNDQCGTGFCTDGVCCDTACDGQCAACDVSGSAGTCSEVASGQPHGARSACSSDGSSCSGSCNGASTVCAYPSASTQCRAASCAGGIAIAAATCAGDGTCPTMVATACGRFNCDSAADACISICSTDNDCSTGNFCSAGVCESKGATGSAVACSANDQCSSAHCADGFCCDSACRGQCEACDVIGSAGTCSPTPAANAPHAGRAACLDDGSGCGGACDGTATLACAYPSSSLSCRGGSCANGIATLPAGCNGAGACPDVQTQVCAPDICGVNACAGNCAADGDCSAGNWCSGGICTPKLGAGTACAATDQCASGFCTDGVCCNTACDGQCAACDVSGSAGTCSEVTSGEPHGARIACSSDGSACSGSCNGTSIACAYPSASTQCRAASCAGGIATAATSCAGDGSCPAMIATSCGRFNCDAAADACISICSTDIDCSAGNFCTAAGVCASQGASGGAVACSANDQCSSAHCADGFCCDSACTGQCQACDVAGSAGTCSPTPASSAPHAGHTACADDGSGCGGVCDGTSTLACAYPAGSVSCRGGLCANGIATLPAACNGAGACPLVQTQACLPYVCGANACEGNCLADGDCSNGNWCSGGICQPKLGAGIACAATDQCASGFCTDGVCCNTACAGQCGACGLPGSAGTCSPIPAGGAPQGPRSACLTDGSGCGGACDGIQVASCFYPAASTTCRDPSCSAGVATLGASCDGAGSCPGQQQQSCGAFACASDACSGDCVSDSDCAAADFCSAGMCTLRVVQGNACSTNDQCGTGFCTDGVCCDSACTGQCAACDVSGSAGICSPTPATSAPRAGHAACADDGSGCGGACDGTSTLACAYPSSAVSCRGGICANGTATLPAGCNGAGACPSAHTQACAPYLCGTDACEGNCLSDGDCSGGDWCSAGICQPKLGPGTACAATGQCASGFCTDGVCCDAACDGQCQACDLAVHLGTCTAVDGAPHGARLGCASDGSACGGICDGTSLVACDYPSGGTQCRASACSSGVATAAASCDGTGACPVREQTTCSTNACAENSCSTGCTADSQCPTDASCVAGACVTNGTPGTWKLAGSGGCASGGAENLLPLLAVLLFGIGQLHRRRWTALHRPIARALVALAWGAPLAAAAQATTPTNTQLVVDRFQPGAGEYDVLSVGSAQTPSSLDVHLAAFFDYANRPLRLIAVDQPSQQIVLLRYQSMLYLGASIGLFDRFELGAVVPLLVAEGASQSEVLGPAISTAGSGIGDLKLVPKAKVFDSDRVRFAIALPFTLPTGKGHAYLSQGNATFSPELRLETNERWLPVQLTADGGIAIRSGRDLVDLQLSNALTYGLAGQVPFALAGQKLAALATLQGEIGLQRHGDVERPLELMGALRWSSAANVSVTVGGGPGISDGYGTPRLRLFAGVSFDPSREKKAEQCPPAHVLAIGSGPLARQEISVEPLAPRAAIPQAPMPVESASPPMALTTLPTVSKAAPEQSVRDGHIALLTHVKFATGKDTILPSSLPILDGVVDVLREHLDYAKVRIDGHTDSVGKAADNRKLSQRRAGSVQRYLLLQGIAPSRLEIRGFGADQPLESNESESGREHNRRVEFVIIDGPQPEAPNGRASPPAQ